MKKILLLFILLTPMNVLAFSTSAKSSILMEVSTNKIILEENADLELPPASMTKMMLLLILLDKIETKEISLNEDILISEKAASMGGSQVYLKSGEKYKLEVLLKSVAIASANDAAVAIAERIAGSTDEAVRLMNEYGSKLGLTHTVFKNVHGLDEEGHFSSARDMAIIASNLVKHDLIFNYSKIYEDYIDHPNGNSTWIVNTNKLINYYDGLDGLKTGFTNAAGYCITATAKKNNIRFISVVMGEENNKIRNEDTLSLLNYGFSNYKLEKVLSKNDDIGYIDIKFGKKEKVKLKLVSDITDLTQILDKGKYSYEIDKYEVKAPIKKGDVVGILKLYKNKEEVRKYNLTIGEDIKKANIFDFLIRNIKSFTHGIE